VDIKSQTDNQLLPFDTKIDNSDPFKKSDMNTN